MWQNNAQIAGSNAYAKQMMLNGKNMRNERKISFNKVFIDVNICYIRFIKGCVL
ncbi:MAG: hypothetical protein FWG36_02875 [Oscillospiraceae bacterium]|nr:hypothetical protein [Oscillospiraceae bacterium]